MNTLWFLNALLFLLQFSTLSHAAPCELSADFDLKSAHIEFDEDAPINTLLFDLPFQGEREEIEQITFKSNELEDFKLNDYFEVNFKSLILKSTYDLDQIETDLVELEFVCTTKTNGTFGAFRNSFLLYLTINDVNDNGPEFMNTPYKFSIKELTPIGTIVYQSIRAYDKDLPNKPNSQISFRIEKGPCSDYFEFPLTTKSDLAVSQLIHYESFSKCLLNIIAEDHGVPQLIANTTVEIDIIDVDDKDPMFTKSFYYGSIRRNSWPGTLINMVSDNRILAKDLDTGLNKTIIYSLNSNPDGLFEIDAKSGEIKLRHAIVDYEKTEYNLILKATQTDNELKSALSMLNIAIVDVNEYAPVFDKNIYVVNVTENSEMDTAICELMATDRDNNRIEYSIFNNHESPFLIDKYKGIIKVNGRLDYEMKSKYVLQVLANDGNYLANVTVIINILNLVDKAPYFESNSYNFKIKIPYDVYIGQVKVIDVENTGNLNFSLIFNNPNHSNLFCVSKTGILFLCPSIASFSNPIVQDESQFNTNEYKFNVSVSIYSSDLRKYLKNTAECFVNVEYDLNTNSNSSLQMLTQSSLGEYFNEDKTIYTLVGIIVVAFVLLIFSSALIIWLKCRKSKFKGRHHHHHKYYRDTTNLAILASNNISSSCAMSDEAQSNSCKESTSGISSCSNKSYEKTSLDKLPQPLYYLKWEDKGLENGIMYGQFASHVVNASCHPNIQTSNHGNYVLDKSSPVSKVTIMSDAEKSTNNSRNNPIRISSYSDILSSAASTLKNRQTPIIIRQDCLHELDKKEEKTLNSPDSTNYQHVDAMMGKENEEEKSNEKFSHITFKFTSPSNTFKKKSNTKKESIQFSSTRLSSFLPTTHHHKSERTREQHATGFVNLMFNQHEPLSLNSETNIENELLKGERIYEDLGKLCSQEQLKAKESRKENQQFKEHMNNCNNSLAKLVDIIQNTTKSRLESNTADVSNNYEEPVDSSLILTSAETYAIEPYYQEEELEMDADETSTEHQSELTETLNEDTEKSDSYQRKMNSEAETSGQGNCSRKSSCVSKTSSSSKKSVLSSITPVSSLSKLTWSTESSISLLPSSNNSASVYTNRDLYINLARKNSNQSASVNSKNTLNQSISNQSTTSTATPSLTITTSSNSQYKLYTVVYHPNGYGSVYV